MSLEDAPVQSDGSGLDDEKLHKFIGKFYIMPEDDNTIFENPFEMEHQVEGNHHRSQVSYVPGDSSTDIIDEPEEEESSGQAEVRSSGQQGPIVTTAADGTKIIQHAITNPPPSKPTPKPEIKPEGTIVSGIRYPKPNTTKKVYTRNGTRITQFNTGMKFDNGTKDPSWKFIPDEYVPGFSDNDGQPNAAGYKYRDRDGEEQKGDLIKQQLKEAVKENNPNYKLHKDDEKGMVDELESIHSESNSSDSRSFAVENQAANSTSSHTDSDNPAKTYPNTLNAAKTKVKSADEPTYQNKAANSLFYHVKPIVSHSQTRHLKHKEQKFSFRPKNTWLGQGQEQSKRGDKHLGAKKKSRHYHLLESKGDNKGERVKKHKKVKNFVRKMPEAAEVRKPTESKYTTTFIQISTGFEPAVTDLVRHHPEERLCSTVEVIQ